VPEVWRKTSRDGKELSTARALAAIADAQWGVVARRQLLDAGVSERAIHGRLTSGLLVPLHRGVYAVGHARLRKEARWLAAVLAVPGAVLSHRDAAGLHGIRPANHLTVDVTTKGRAADHKGIEVHRTRMLDEQDVTLIQGIPVTSLARTLVDLAGVVPRDHVHKALRQAEKLHVFDVRALRDVLRRTQGRPGPGHRALREALAEHEALGLPLTRSSLEDAFLRLVHSHGLPKPQTNVFIEGIEVDALWREQRLVVELDGWAHHHERYAFQRDRTRDATLMTAGWRIVRFTHADVMRRAEWTAGVLRKLLAAD
jgi:very-short-patch-repair endonuclease